MLGGEDGVGHTGVLGTSAQDKNAGDAFQACQWAAGIAELHSAAARHSMLRARCWGCAQLDCVYGSGQAGQARSLHLQCCIHKGCSHCRGLRHPRVVRCRAGHANRRPVRCANKDCGQAGRSRDAERCGFAGCVGCEVARTTLAGGGAASICQQHLKAARLQHHGQLKNSPLALARRNVGVGDGHFSQGRQGGGGIQLLCCLCRQLDNRGGPDDDDAASPDLKQTHRRRLPQHRRKLGKLWAAVHCRNQIVLWRQKPKPAALPAAAICAACASCCWCR